MIFPGDSSRTVSPPHRFFTETNRGVSPPSFFEHVNGLRPWPTWQAFFFVISIHPFPVGEANVQVSALHCAFSKPFFPCREISSPPSQGGSFSRCGDVPLPSRHLHARIPEAFYLTHLSVSTFVSMLSVRRDWAFSLLCFFFEKLQSTLLFFFPLFMSITAHKKIFLPCFFRPEISFSGGRSRLLFLLSFSFCHVSFPQRISHPLRAGSRVFFFLPFTKWTASRCFLLRLSRG